MICRAASFIQWQKQSQSQISEDIKPRKPRIISSPNIMHNLRNHEHILKDDQPFIIGEEVGEGEIHKQPHIELNVECS